MKYAYEDMSDDQFENLVVCICRFLFGLGVQGFAKGKDGGRDAKFVGTAENHPSKASPWSGTTIIQAKHTIGLNKSFSENDFYNENSDKTILGEEIPRIKNLRATSQLDNYIIFANRRLTGNTESALVAYIASECGIPPGCISIFGVEQIELSLKWFPDAAKYADLDPIDSPLIVSPDELAEVVEAFARQRESILAVLNDEPPSPRITYEKKNQLNNMTAAYAKELRKKYLKETAEIKAFLAAPENYELLQLYESIVDEFQLKIIAKRRDYQTFDDVLEHLATLLYSRDAVLRQRAHKPLTRLLLFYMYWNCDIGDVGDNDA